jgi:hypothetical protein
MKDAKETHRMEAAVRQAETANGTEAKARIKVRRLNIALAEKVYQEVLSLANEMDKNITEVIRIALGVLRIIVKAIQRGERVIITGGNQPDREIVFPGML